MFPLTEPKIEINKSPTRLTILISQTRNWAFIGFLIFWLAFALILFPMAGTSSDRSILCLIFPPILLISLYPIYMLLWHLGGKERIEVEAGQMNVYEIRPLWQQKKVFALNQIEHLRKAESTGFDVFLDWGMERWGMTNGKITFDCGQQTNRFGKNMNDTQTELVLKTLSEWLAPKSQI